MTTSNRSSETRKLALAAGFCVLAVGLFVWLWRSDSAGSERAFYYDVSAQKLFVAPRNAIPPIRGCDGKEEDGMRAVVISTNGNPRDRKSWTIAYLEQCSPELKRQMLAAQTGGTPPEMGRALAQAHRFVRRLRDGQWYSLASPEAEKIVSEWLTAGPNGRAAVLCTP